MDLYRENILDHYHNPRNWGLQDDYTVNEEGTNTLCGDKIIVQVDVVEGKVRNMRFEGEGCAISRAAASLLSENVKGQSINKVREMSIKNVEEWLGVEVPPMRVKCATLALETMQLALACYEKLDKKEHSNT